MKITIGKILRVVCALSLTLSFTAFGGCFMLSELGDTTPPDTGSAQQTPGEEGQTTEIPEIPEISEIPDGDETQALPTELDFTPAAVTEKYGYAYFAGMENGRNLCGFYYELYKAACAFKNSTKNVSPKTIGLGGDETITVYIVETLDYGKYSLSAEQAMAVWKTFRMEYPEFYWMDNQVTYSSTTLNIHTFSEYAQGVARTAIEAKIEQAANDCFAYLDSDMTQTERALTLYDYVALTTAYTYESDGVTPEDAAWAHNLVGWADGGKGVCETYAKVYDYLCGLIGLDCITVAGYAGLSSQEWGGHAWNIVKIDGVWYTIDVTWGDASATLSREWFGEAAATFAQSHTADEPTEDFGLGWQFALPALSENKLSPVRMSENEVGDTMYGCIDYAFSKMTNEGGMYALTLYPDTTVTSAKGASVQLQGASFSTSVLPKVSELSVIGKRQGFTKAKVTANNPITLNGDLTVTDAELSATVHKNGYTYSKDWF